MSLDNLTFLPKTLQDVSSDLESVRNKIKFIVEAAYGSSVKQPLSLEATIGFGIILVQIDKELEEVQKKLGVRKSSRGDPRQL
ncbi:MAG: hypothetical protein C0614_01370 [Desulfuromonas sp.]|nr:MAG: hypothetical protein C0614_01370 [Desulfuromonas sp.]